MNVIVKKCENYELELVKNKVHEIFNELDFLNKINKEKKIFLKLNLVGEFDKLLAITNHTILLKAVLE